MTTSNEASVERIVIRCAIEGAKPATPRRLPREQIRLSREPRELGWPGDEYSAIRRKVGALHLKKLVPDQAAQLAAILTAAKFLDRAIWQFYRSRNRANDVLDEVHRLQNTRSPWPPGATDMLDAALARLDADPVLICVRDAGQVAAAAWPVSFPLRDRLEAFRRFLAAPGPRAWRDLQRLGSGFEDFAATHVGATVSIPVDIDGVGRFLLPGGLDIQADNVGRWTAWAVGGFLEDAVRRRGASALAGEVIDAVLGDITQRNGEPLDIGQSRYKAWLAYFGGKRRRDGKGDYGSAPAALWLANVGGLAARFERLA